MKAPTSGEGSISSAISMPASGPSAAAPAAAPGGPLNEQQQKLGRSLLAAGALTHQDLQRNIEKAGKQNAALAKALLASGFASEDELIAAIVSKHRVPRINLKTTKIPLETIELMKEESAKRLRALPLDEIGEVLVVVTPDLFNADALQELRRTTGRRLALVQCSEEGFDEAVAGYYKRLAESKPPAAAGGPSGSVPVALPGLPPAAPRPAPAPAAPPPAPAAPPAPPPAPAPAAAMAAAPSAAGPVVAALPADAAEMSAARPIDGPQPWDRRPDWDWAFTSAGPVVAAEVMM